MCSYVGTAYTYLLQLMGKPLSAAIIALKGVQVDLAGTVLQEHYKAFGLEEKVPGVFPVEVSLR